MGYLIEGWQIYSIKVPFCTTAMKIFSPRLVVGIILQMEYVCLVGLIKFTDGSIYVRLVNPSSWESNPSAGRIEIRWYYGFLWGYSSWGTVCRDGFTDAAARVVCSSLGFSRTGSVITNSFGAGSGNIWLDDVVCTGTETGIGSCSHRTWGEHNCGHHEDVAIDCVDGCSGGRALCDLTTTTCVDTVGGYSCSCWNGYTYSTSTSCTDINECYTWQFQCDSATTTCTNTVGSYRCSCKSGYRQFNSTTCTDINECTSGQNPCDLATTTCENTVGSYRCSCKNGHISYTSTSCTDMDECTTRQSQCDTATTMCINTVGSYYCSCRNGYRNLISSSCTDVDECERGEHLCDNLTTICINNGGSYHCVCRTGYERENAILCSDINECVSGKSECDLMSTDCINTIGNYTCDCRNGFTYLNETTCVDINECVSGESECDLMSTDCINTIGNYTCDCRNGFTYLNGATCVEKRLKAIVGSSVGTFLAVALIAIILTFFYWKRRKTLQTESSVVDNGSGVDNSTNSNIYMVLKKPDSDMTGKEEIYVQLDASTRLPVPNKKPKETAESAVDENTQSAIYGNVQSTGETVQYTIDEDAQFSANGNFEFSIYENARN